MKRTILRMVLIIILLSPPVYAQYWEHISPTIGENTIHHISVDELNPLNVLAASSHHLYITRNGGKTWKKIFQTVGEEVPIHFIYSEPLYTKNIFIGTPTTLYTSTDNGLTWKKLFVFPENNENVIFSFSVNPFNPHELTLGTSTGLYISTTSGLYWEKMRKILKNEEILSIAYHPNIKGLLFATTNRGIYTINHNNDAIRKTYSFVFRKEETDEYGPKDTCIEFLSSSDDVVLVSCDGMIYASDDRGNTWSRITDNFGRKSDLINISPAIDAQTIFISQKDHIITYNLRTKSIKTISGGLSAAYIYDLVFHDNKESILFSATNKGIFATHFTSSKSEQKIQFIEVNPQALERLSIAFQKEPSIRDIQKKAIQYANVRNNKIKRWHRNARLRAFMPTLSVDFEKTIADTVELDRGSTSVKDTFIVGPHEEDLSWEVSFEWELGNIMWNPNQTAIDYREKYMIKLRDDIRHQVTTLYYERRRLQLQLYLTPPHASKEYLSHCLKIDELTAQIDALTGGFFTTCLNQENK